MHAWFRGARLHGGGDRPRPQWGRGPAPATPHVELIEHDLETGSPFPVAGRAFDAVVVTNYLWRPILDDIARAVAPDGWLLYETFAAGNERLGHPSNPDFLLRPGELLDLSRAHGLHVVAYENLEVDEPRPAVVERVAATRS